MTPRRAVFALAAALALPCGAAATAAEPRAAVTARAELSFAPSAEVVADIDGDGRAEIVLVAEDGAVRVVRRAEDGSLGAPQGELVLPHPERTLLAVADIDGSGALHLVTLSPEGLRAYPAVPGAAFAARPLELAPRARFVLRVGAPRLARIVRDVDGDGRADVVLPLGAACELWTRAKGAESGEPLRYERVASVAVDVQRTESTNGGALTDVLEGGFRIPDLRTEDVNGDGRADLLVVDGKVRAFHLQRADGTLPAEPDVKVDLALFRDTTPDGELRLGHTLAGGDDARYESRDLDGDGIPDHVIAHRRKVWVFLGGRDGPQFTQPAAILKTADDVTALLLVRVDDDALPDLVLVRVQVPSAAGLLRGLVAEWDVDIATVGYRNVPDGVFATTPAWRGTLTVRLPAILGVLRDPDALLRRFEQVAARFRDSLETDLDGDGTADVLLVADGDAPHLDAWFGRGARGGDPDAERALGDALFGADGERTWTIDALLGWLGSMAERRASRLTGGRDADASVPLRGAEFVRRALLTGDLDGDGRSEVVVVSTRREDGNGVLDVVSAR